MNFKIPFLRRTSPSPSRPSFQRFVWLLSAVLTAIVVISCVTVDRLVMSPPRIPGATFVGNEACAACHEEKVKNFKTATHNRLVAKGKNAEGAGCESCHGPGSKHVEAGGGRNTLKTMNIVNPYRSPDVCFQCHVDKRGEFNLPYTHPVLKGKMSCTDCHEPHKGDAVMGGGATHLHGANETCFHCHTAQRGPFIFEHEALREGCTVCHKVHGSVNAKLLSERNANLCLKCHAQKEMGAGTVTIGGRNHTGSLSGGTCFSADCHDAVHGSQVNSSLRR